MRLTFTTIQGARASIRVTKAEYAQLVERFTVRGARAEIDCPLCERYLPLGEDCDADHKCPLFYCLDVVPGLVTAAAVQARLWGTRAVPPPQYVTILRNFRRFIRRAAARGRRK